MSENLLLLFFIFTPIKKISFMEDEEFNYQSYEEKRKAADENMKKVEAETRNWLETNENIKTYFNRFGKYWADDFVKGYPVLKARFMRYGHELGDQPEKHQIAYLEKAAEALAIIQLKKLFDVMCQWDANLLKLDGIDCSWDFLPWEEDIFNCPFISPVTDEDVKLYLQFMDTEEWDKHTEVMLIHYESYRDEDAEYDRIPAWFIFENDHSGNDKYLQLPKERTEKEEFYRGFWFKERDAEFEKKYESGELKRHVPDERPQISIHKYTDVERFIQEHEGKDVLIAFRKYYDYFTEQLIREDPDDEEDGWLNEQVDSIIHHLTGVKEKIPIEANDDWREGLIEAFEAYERKQIKEALPYAYSDYQMRRELNIDTADQKKKSDNAEHARFRREQILRGRELNGEPRDFNF